MNHYNKLISVLEVRGTKSQAMLDIEAVSARIRAKKERLKKGRAAAKKAKKEKWDGEDRRKGNYGSGYSSRTKGRRHGDTELPPMQRPH